MVKKRDITSKTMHQLADIVIVLLTLLAFSTRQAYADGTLVIETDNPNISTDGQCSLIEAIVNANDDAQTYTDCPHGSGTDTIILQGDTVYALTAVDNDTDGPNGLPAIVSTIVISGNGATIARNATPDTPAFRIFYITNEGNLTLDDLTISNGEASGNDSAADGGGICNRGGEVMVNYSVITNNIAESGGGIGNFGILTVTHSTVSSNVARFGGGIYNVDVVYWDYEGQVTVSASTISNNTADVSGGGIYNAGDIHSGFGSVSVDYSTISGNLAGSGGGIENWGWIVVNSSTISGNTSESNGGGIYNNLYGTVEVNNSTISGNAADNNGGGIYTYGNLSVTINHSTISSNVADNDKDGGGSGGGVYATNTVRLTHTILATNSGQSASATDCAATLTSNGYNLIQDTTGCTIIGDTTGNITGQAPLLGPLADNGGNTQTHGLLPGSVAIDAGDPTFTAPPDFDQRGPGFPRVVGGRVDIGAFEYLERNVRLYLPIVWR